MVKMRSADVIELIKTLNVKKLRVLQECLAFYEELETKQGVFVNIENIEIINDQDAAVCLSLSDFTEIVGTSRHASRFRYEKDGETHFTKSHWLAIKHITGDEH